MFAILLSDKMDPFYQNISSFPTVIFSLLLVLCLVYWLGAILGLVDLDFLDFELPDADAADAASVAEVLGGLLTKYGLIGVPVTVIVSFLSLFGWLISYFTVHFVFHWIPAGLMQYLAGVPVILVAFYAALFITAWIVKWLRPLFKNSTQPAVKHIIGQTAIVRSSRLDRDFGEVYLDDKGAGLIFSARSNGNNIYKKGDRVVLIEYVKQENIYRVISEHDFLN